MEDALSMEEAVELAAADSVFYSHFFFPATARAKTPAFHREMWAELENPVHRYYAAMVFRDGAKTSLFRLYVSKRIAFGLSRTIVFVGKGEDHARRSVEWIMHHVERNRTWADVYGLRPGAKWSSTELEIVHSTLDITISVLALGMTGQVRGINIDDFRPDLIVVDDPCDHENTATPEQRQKIAELFFGAIYPSLVPSAENPLAKMALLQTPLAEEDLVSTCIKDPQWHGNTFGCFDERGESRWPERKPVEMLREEKEGFIARNQASIWYREMECTLVAPETAAFRGDWLRVYERAPEGGVSVIGIDPVPPPSDIQIAKGLRGKDDEVLAVVKRVGPDYYLLDYSRNKGHTPEWTVSEFFRLAVNTEPRPIRVVVEAVAYQRTLAWILRKAMQVQGQFFPVEELVDRRKKFDRIVDTLSGISSAGHLWVKAEHFEFIEQFRAYPGTRHDDVLEAVSIAVMKLMTLTELAVASGLAPPALLSKGPDRPNFRVGVP
jgi:phage terminase large subunit-like protein